MQTAKDLKQYRRQLQDAMHEDFQRQALDNFVQAYRQGRAKAFAGMDLKELTSRIGANKQQSLSRLEELYQEFRARAEE
ncbi:MAG: (Fe-S)-binding protein, partial [Desulfohalobiaceae bacterium]